MTKNRNRRFFKIGERVFNYAANEPDNYDYGKILLINGKNEDGIIDDETIVTLAMEHNDYTGENEVYGDCVYKICKAWSDKFKETICYNHKKKGFNYFVPAVDYEYTRKELVEIFLKNRKKKGKPALKKEFLRDYIPDLNPLFRQLKRFLMEKQGKKGYIATQSEDCPLIFTYVYVEEINMAEEKQVYGVRYNPISKDVEIIYEDITNSHKVVYSDKDYKESKRWTSLCNDEEIYFVPTLFNICENIEDCL